MTEKCISSVHIQKLGHEILEIRERALLNIISKLDHGFTFDNDLARSKEIIAKLFEWFLFTPSTKQELVFSLIKRILLFEGGQTLIAHQGSTIFKNELQQIRTYIQPKYYPQLEEILRLLDDSRVLVPPLETDVPLSYRTGQSDFTGRPVGTTATTIEGFVHQESSIHPRNTPLVSGGDNSFKSDFILKWQFLIEADRHVLQSIENSLKNPPQPAVLLHSADFFVNILLSDFPAEVFLQRPNIILAFFDLLNNCPSTRIVNSILNCLIQLTKALQIRINCNNDPLLHTSKENVGSGSNFSQSSSSTTSRQTASGQSEDDTSKYENVDYLKTQQISFQRYCHEIFKHIFKYLCVKPENIRSNRRKSNQKGINLALNLINEISHLLELVVDDAINDILIGYGDTLEYFRVESGSQDLNVNIRSTQLCLLHNCADFFMKMVPMEQSGLLLPRNLKKALVNSLVDVTLAKLYPNLYNTLLNYVQSFKVGLDNDTLFKYQETLRICDSMTAAVDFMKNHKSFDAFEGITVAEKALPSLEFHRDLIFVKQVVEICANKLPLHPGDDALMEKFENVILRLLSHNLESVREETYKLCQRRVIGAIGPRLNMSCSGAPGAQIIFLCRSKVLVEVACHGMTSENHLIRNCSEDILIHIIKCKILVTEEIWNRIVVALIGALPILLCHSNKESAFGRSLLNILDPDTAESLNLPKIDTVKGNILMLFGTESSVREEAFSRLCWLLATQADSREMLPRLNNLYDKALPNVCHLQRVLDVNKHRATQHFYQPSSLQQVLDLLKSPNVEPVIRRSALTQISVMLEDPLLHATFLTSDGLNVIQSVLKSALLEKNFNDYPDSAVPIISILKNVCLFQNGGRQSLCHDVDVYYNVLRSLFMFFTEEKLRCDAVSLLFLLIFNDFIKGTPSKGNLSIPYLVGQKLQVPFSCNTHWEISQYYEANIVEILATDRWCLSSLQIQWNCEIFGGLDELLSLKEINYDDDINIVDILKMTEYDLASLKSSSIDFYVRRYLNDVQNGSLHESVIGTLDKLTMYVQLSSLVPKIDNFLDHHWEGTFSHYLKILPSSEEDAKLLSNVLTFLKYLTPFYKSSSDATFWLPQILKNPSNCLLDLIRIDQSTGDDFKILSQELLSLVTLCASQEQHFLDYYTTVNLKISENSLETWRAVIEIIANTLAINDNSHFYNLAYLDSLLSCLVTLTASLGWTNSKPGSPPKKTFFQLVASLTELIVVFHCGKGPTATVSVMGLSITRHVILILNHLVAEMQNFKMKNWEKCFIDIEEEDWLKSFLVLWSSRDVLVRAGVLQLFAGLSVSPILAVSIVNQLKNENGGVWNMSLGVLLDQEEASIVRENSAVLVSNLLEHSVDNKSQTITTMTTIFDDLDDDYQFFKGVVVTLSKLGDSTVTPSLVKNMTQVFLSLLNLDEQRLCCKLQDTGIVKLLFRYICNPEITIQDTKKLALYCDILEMDITICTLLSQVAHANFTCLGTLLHTKDCLINLVSLLNPHIYDTHLPQLVYLRNRLWSEIFKLLAVLTTYESDCHSSEALVIMTEAIEEAGGKAFIETLCQATKNMSFNDLQNSALLSLTSLLGVESQSNLLSGRSSMRSILDTVRTSPEQDDTIAGEEICKILLNLYDLCNLKLSKDLLKKKSIITSSLTSILCISQEAKKFALNSGLPTLIIKQLKDFYIRLSLESVDSLRRVLEKKRVCPILKELNELVGLTTNFIINDEIVKNKFAELGLSDFIHKLWVWFVLQNTHLGDVLRMLATFTTDCTLACQSLPLTSCVAGSGPRKAPSKISLLHAIMNLVEKEMEMVSKTHNLETLELSFVILKNCCAALECRLIICKTTLLGSISRLHPAITKKQKPWDLVELLWLEFLQTFTQYPEGQSCLAKVSDVFDILLALTSSSRLANRITALLVIRNVAFYHSNRPRLLTSDEFLNLLQHKLQSGNHEEKMTVILMMWSLAANNQKAKIVFKAAKLDAQIQQVLKHYQLATEMTPNDDDISTIKYVLSVIRDGDVCL